MANKKYRLTAYYRKAGEKKWSELDVVMSLTPKDIEGLKHLEFWSRPSRVRDKIYKLMDFDPKSLVAGDFVDYDDFSVVEVKQ